MRRLSAIVLLAALSASAQTPAPSLDEALDAPARAHIVNEYARRLTEMHVDPARAKQAADTLRQRLANGAYDDRTTARSLAALVSRDVASVIGDRHTYLEYVPYDQGDERQRPAPAPQPNDNFGLRKYEALGNNIGYLQINRFAPYYREAIEAAGRFMSQAADHAALVIDLRDAGGDGQDMAALLSSYVLDDRRSYVFADAQIHLHDQADRSGRAVHEYWSNANVAGRRFGGWKPLYILVSERTAAAAEGFAYDLQQYDHRAVIVGAPTAGDARVGWSQRISRQLRTSLSITRAVNPYSRGNWDGMGVQPDVVVKPADALNTALALARAAIHAPRAARPSPPAQN